MDPWATGPYPAGPVEPILRQFGQDRISDRPKPPRWADALTQFASLLSRATSDERAARLSELMDRPDYQFDFAAGFARGYLAGGLRGLGQWIGDLQDDIAMYTGEPLALAKVAGHELLRGLFEDDPQGLAKDTRLVIQSSQLLAPVRLLAILTARDSLSSLLEDVDLIAGDLITAVATATREWQDRFLDSTGDPTRQGILIGEFYGELVVVSIRVGVELLVL